MKGFSSTLGGDDRFLNNMIMGVGEEKGEFPKNVAHAGSAYDHYSVPEEYVSKLKAAAPSFYETAYNEVPQSVWFADNAYAGNAKPYRAEKNPIRADGMYAQLEESNGVWILSVTIPESVANASCQAVTTSRLGMPRLTEQPFENADGTPIDFTMDYLGNRRLDHVIPGPFATLKPGTQKIVVWQQLDTL